LQHKFREPFLIYKISLNHFNLKNQILTTETSNDFTSKQPKHSIIEMDLSSYYFDTIQFLNNSDELTFDDNYFIDDNIFIEVGI
jgi:hypothetical protein